MTTANVDFDGVARRAEQTASSVVPKVESVTEGTGRIAAASFFHLEHQVKSQWMSTSASVCSFGNSQHVLCESSLGTQELRSVAYKIAGTCGSEGTPIDKFKYSEGLEVAQDGTVFAADFFNNRVKVLTPPSSGVGDWSQSVLVSNIGMPRGMLYEGGDSLLIAFYDNSASSYVLRRYGATNGSVLATIATDLGNVHGIAAFGDGQVLVASADNHCIFRVNLHDGSKTAFAGTCGTSGPNNDGALLFTPTGVATASNGDVYIADNGNHCIKKVDASNGSISVFAGSCSTTGTTSTTNIGSFNGPQSIDVTPDGGLLVADNKNYCIKRISPSGIVSAAAGICGSQGANDGHGMGIPRAVAASGGTSFVFSDNDRHCIKTATFVG